MSTAITRSPARTVGRAIAIACGALALACSSGGAQAYGGWHGGGYHGGGWGPGPFWGAIGLGLGIGLIGSSVYYDNPATWSSTSRRSITRRR